MAGRVAGKMAFVTGGAQGLGAAMARMLAQEGAKVSIADINHHGAKAVAAEINAALGEDTAFAFPLDVTKEDQWIYALEEADAAMGGISVLVNNAGISRGGNIEQLSYEDWKLVMSVNVDSVFLGTKHALRYMRAHQPGSIINISSESAIRPLTRVAGYGVAKAAVTNFTKYMCGELATKYGDGLRVNAIAPGFFITEQNRTLLLNPDGSYTERSKTILAHTPYGRFGEPSELLGTLQWLASDASKFVSGTMTVIDGGFDAFSI